MPETQTRTTADNGDVMYRNERDQLHRTDGPAIERASGNKEWFFNGKHHRIGGPAVENHHSASGYSYQAWFVLGKLHRTDGPAVIRGNGLNGQSEWWVHGTQLDRRMYPSDDCPRVVIAILDCGHIKDYGGARLSALPMIGEVHSCWSSCDQITSYRGATNPHIRRVASLVELTR